MSLLDTVVSLLVSAAIGKREKRGKKKSNVTCSFFFPIDIHNLQTEDTKRKGKIMCFKIAKMETFIFAVRVLKEQMDIILSALKLNEIMILHSQVVL